MTIDFYGSKLSLPCRVVELVAKYLKIDLKEKPLCSGEHLKPPFIIVSYVYYLKFLFRVGF